MTSFELNGQTVTVRASSDTPLLWVLREELKALGTKFGCGAALCGACTVIVDGAALRSCVMPLAAIAGKSVLTIEGLGGDHPVQQAWIEGSVAQCGYCQSGQIMSTVALLQQNPSPSEAEIRTALAGNLCRCGTYPRIVQAVQRAAELLGEAPASARYFDAGAVRREVV
jgi:isoquinoline 1-oxidoreductase alpha subunit